MGQNNPYRSSSDTNQSHARTSAAGHSGGNAGAGKSGGEDLGTEKKIDDERFGSSKPMQHTSGRDDEGKKDAPGKNDEASKND